MPYSRDFRIVEAPSILGLKPTGVDRLPDALREAGFHGKLSAPVAARLPAPEFYPHRDSVTHLLNADAIADYSRALAKAVLPVVQSKQFRLC